MNAAVFPIFPPGGPGPEQKPEHHRGQLRFAERFVAAFGNQFLHAHGIGWHEYDGSRWDECRDGGEVRGVLKLIREALDEVSLLDKEARNDLVKDINRVENAAGVNGVLELAKNMHPCTLPAAKLDSDATLLNTLSGTVDVITGEVRAPNPTDRISKTTNAVFNAAATDSVFEAFLERAHPNKEMREFIARSLGSALLGRVREHVLLIWHGSGANGKGTLRDAVRYAMGDYAVEVPADILLQTKYGQQGLAPERMRLKGVRMAFCSEIANGARLDEATMKKLTGGDPVTAKLLYRNPVEFDPSHTLVMLTNYLPTVRGDDPAVWRRILAVPFDVIVPPEERDGELPEKLKAAAPAVLAWLWRGWLDYQRKGLNPPAAVLEATRKYQLDSDLLARFLDEATAEVMLGHGSVASAVLYRAFSTWCRSEGEEVSMTNKAFTEAMELRGFVRKRSSAGQSWQHVMIVEKDHGGGDDDRT